MRITTPSEVADQAGNKYLGVLVAARFARYLNELPRERIVQQRGKAHHQGARRPGQGRARIQARAPPPLRGLSVWAGRHVVLGVSGGIACYKSCILARRLAEAGAAVDAVLTRGAAEFVRPVAFEALTGRSVLTSLWERGGALSHVRLGQQADLVIVAPATAHLLARVAQGMADDVLTALLLARTAPVLVAPAMNDEMYANPATQRNLAALRSRGFAVVGPETGALAEGPSERPGRMSEPDTILAHAARVLRGRGPLRAAGWW